MDETNFRQPPPMGGSPSQAVTSTTNKPFHTYENASYDGDEMLDIDIDENATSSQANSQKKFTNVAATTTTATPSATSNSSRPASLPMSRSAMSDQPFPDPNNGPEAAVTVPSSSAAYPTNNGSFATKSPVMTNAVNLVTKLMPSGNVTQSPMESIKEWSVSTFKFTRQLVNERLGKCSKTSDVQLEAEIERLRESQRKYTVILKTAQQMNVQYSQLVQTQRQLYESMNEMAMRYCSLGSSASNGSLATSQTNGARSIKHHTNAVTVTNNLTSSSSTTSLASSQSVGGIPSDFSPVLNHMKMSSNINIGEDFRKNAMALSIAAKNGEKLIAALRFFCFNLSTLITKTIEDTLNKIRAFEMARLEYDAERNSLNNCMMPSAQTSINATSDKIDSARCKYEQLREDVQIKMKFLDENKLKVMHKQLVLFNSAFAAYASGNTGALEAVLKQFSIR